jgi:hypothetical protein
MVVYHHVFYVPGIRQMPSLFGMDIEARLLQNVLVAIMIHG